MTMAEICNRLGRTQGEMFRMVQVLSFRGYLAQDKSSDGYYVSDRLFSMAMQQPRTRGLVELALPKMRGLAMKAGQSCHLTMYSHGETVVVARMESDEQLGFTVRVGYRASALQTTSGLVLFSAQPPDIRERWIGHLPATTKRKDIDEFIARADATAKAGYVCAKSSFVDGVTDIAAPIFRGGRAVAALAMPFIRQTLSRIGLEEATELLVAVAKEISAELHQADNRV